MSAFGLAASFLIEGCAPSAKSTANQNTASADVAGPQKKTEAPAKPPRSAKPDPSKALASANRPKIDQLIGLDEASLRAFLGEPTTQEDTAPSKLWVYHRRQCTMNVTLYPDVETKKFHALNYEVNANDSSARQQQCTTQFASQLSALPPPG